MRNKCSSTLVIVSFYALMMTLGVLGASYPIRLWAADAGQMGDNPSLPPGYTANMPPPGPFEARLDDLLKKRQYEALNKTASDVHDVDMITRALDWERSQVVFRGQGGFVAILYAQNLWRASSLPDPRAPQFKELRGDVVRVGNQ